ncbi:MAG TPA: PP2C family serine/threonine-protein phosphatase [Verrucomicrobiales bacterium]|nr:PP2C family serine/threonine-protein phosphatase [Verrucomicrobiales bacterium]
MNENLDYLRKLFGRKGASIDPSREALFLDFARNSGTQEDCGHVSGWEEKIMRDWKEKTVRSDLAAAPVALANGMVGREYRSEIRLGAMDSALGEHRCLLDAVPGIDYDPATRLLTGIPTEAGEFDITLEFQPAGMPDSQWSQKIVKFIVNHDPKSLWKDEPSDREDPYWQADEAVGFAEFGGHLVLAASKRGRSHAHEGKFRDDAFRLASFPETNWGVIAVSDGAGASKYSRKGSVLACDAVDAYFRSFCSEQWSALDEVVISYLAEANESTVRDLNAILPDVIGKAALDAQHAIRKEATLKAAEMRDYSCTLIFALVKQFPSHFVVASFWVGDGGIGLYQETLDSVHVLGEPDSGEYAGQTRFLTMSDIFSGHSYLQRIKFKAVEDFTALVLMTDGITDPKFQTDANLKNPVIWKSLWDEIAPFGAPVVESEAPGEVGRRETALLEWLDFWSAGNHDDRTIVILYGTP